MTQPVERQRRVTPYRFTSFHALFRGRCGECGENFDIGAVIYRRLSGGFAHAVCPVQGDVPLAD